MLLENYQFAVLPAISAISPNSGSAAGQLLSITGSGFSLDKTKVSVSVDGIPCAVVDSTLTNINCQLAKKNNNASTALPTNSASQQQGYYSGNGLAYTRYNLGSIRGIANFQNSYASLTVLESGFRGEIETGDYYGSYYGEVFKGYFTAPVSGTYTFRGVGDDEFSVSLSSSYGSAEVNTTMLIFSNQPQYL